MCGIAGLLTTGEVDAAVLRRMAGSLAHRGPDDAGIWSDQNAGIGLAHRRLSIVDLSPGGHQPMVSANGRWLLVFNGEIYNHTELRRVLEEQGREPEGGWRGHSDTETLLEAMANWGMRRTIEGAVGMFALAAWDRQERCLHLARDRFGEKPLYYGWAGRTLLFGSELKALHCHPDFSPEVDRQSLALFAARGYVPAPRSIYRGVFKLPPATILAVTAEALRGPPTEAPEEPVSTPGLSLQRYWSYREVVQRGLDTPIAGEEAIERLDAALGQAIRGQSIADVPVGAFLSGGIDSSLVTALYQRHSGVPVRTYTIGFKDKAFDESGHARAVAAHLGTIHHEHVVGEEEAREVIPLLPSIYDEPFADSSQIPTVLVSRFARHDVTVALTGDGGDELFGGYNRHVLGPRLWRMLAPVPRPVRALAGPLARLPSGLWQRLSPGPRPHAGGRISRGLNVAATARGLHDIYGSFIDEWRFHGSPVAGEHVAGPDFSGARGWPPAMQLMTADALGYLPDDILCKVDRASMAVSLETRVPFLDHRVAEVAARIPLSLKIQGKTGKRVLRELLGQYLPQQVFSRPKAGFAIPVGEWIKGPLRPWAESLLAPARLRAEGHFDADVVGRRWQGHLSGRANATAAIWGVLMFQAWLDGEKEGVANLAA